MEKIHHILEHWVKVIPDKIYLLGEHTYTFRQLEGFSNAIATVVTEVESANGNVAMWFDKSSSIIGVIIGILKAGRCYVPVDGEQPIERVRHIVSDAGATVLCLDLRHLKLLRADGIPEHVSAIILIDEGCTVDYTDDGIPIYKLGIYEYCESDVKHRESSVVGERAAILYTSGSTGFPKGVVVSHKNLENFISWSISELSVDRDDVFMNHANFNFDLSTFDIFISLRLGASLWVANDVAQCNAHRLLAAVEKHRISIIYAVPSIFCLMSRSGCLPDYRLSSLRYILFAGEVMPAKILTSLLSCLSHQTTFYNFYGPTETNVCLYYKVKESDAMRMQPVPIGYPIANTSVSILYEEGEENVGEVGELIVRGACVTPGYWNRDSDRNTKNHQLGVHATGDYVSYENDVLVYRGRIDRMVKINGYRVELGEIEAALLTYSNISDVAAICKVNNGSHVVINVYYSTYNGEICKFTDLKYYSSQKLPRYMIPRFFLYMEELPKNANGKTDYIKLQDQKNMASDLAQGYCI